MPLWAASDFPIRLAFDHAATTSPITSADSVALWTVIHQMEADVGRTLFKPVDFSSLTRPDANGYTPKTVLGSVDNTLTGFSGYTNWIWDANQNMIAAKTRDARLDQPAATPKISRARSTPATSASISDSVL